MRLNLTKLILLVFITLSTRVTLAQSHENDRPNQIFITPLRAIDPINPGFELGYQRAYGKNLATSFAVARMTSVIDPEIDFSNYKGWRLDIEQKYFLPTRRRNFRMYVAANAMYLKVNYKADEAFAADSGSNTPSYLDNVDIHKLIIAGNLKYGVQLLWKHIVFDFYGGFGGELRRVTQSGMIDPHAYRVPPRELNLSYGVNEPYDGLALSLTLNARIAYEF
ncbi:hypothetical protein [Mucilaginibacter sp. dw_454]|uniref:hypothetical protein n=1 Tax=Mucilaginibacter sp. dw_454 TaxID=2720079 RepID=UPI001BD33754|nr:hypothetical protein [Mucilaginibacter sp. dw_454]